MGFDAWIWLALALATLLLFYVYRRTGHFFRCLLAGIFSGLTALGVLWIASHFFEIGLAVTPMTVAISSLFGVPGVVGMLLLPLL